MDPRPVLPGILFFPTQQYNNSPKAEPPRRFRAHKNKQGSNRKENKSLFLSPVGNGIVPEPIKHIYDDSILFYLLLSHFDFLFYYKEARFYYLKT